MEVTIRNFCIIAHIDHGKSTLADRLLELTGTVDKRQMKEQFLDKMDLERERGITIKLAPVRMIWRPRTNADVTQTDADNGELLYKDLTYKIRGACFNVRKKIGLGHKENVYHNALIEELKQLGVSVDREKTIPVYYGDKSIGIYRPDIVVENKIIVELKALPFIGKKEQTQIWTYLKGSEYKLALLINFSSNDVHIKRIVFDIARDQSQRESASSQRESANSEYILNLIDTPGHVDFSYEVSRSLAAVEGAILLVDASQGVQAQTIANLTLAIAQGLTIVPAVNKVDLPNVAVEESVRSVAQLIGCAEDEVLRVSGKTGLGVEALLKEVVRRVPPPRGSRNNPLAALIFDSQYDTYRGVVAYVRVMEGSVKKGELVTLMGTGSATEALEVGSLSPGFVPAQGLQQGEIGYIVTGLKEVRQCRVGDTITSPARKALHPLPGYREVRPYVFAGLFAKDGEAEELREAIEKLQLNDASLTYAPQRSTALGFGFRCGFLGLLHLEIVIERLRREYNLEIIATVPNVEYKVVTTRASVLASRSDSPQKKTRSVPPASEPPLGSRPGSPRQGGEPCPPGLRDTFSIGQSSLSDITAEGLPHNHSLAQEKGDKGYLSAEELNRIGALEVKMPQEFPDPTRIEKVFEPWVHLTVITPSTYIGNLIQFMQGQRGIAGHTEYLADGKAILHYDMPLSSIIVNFYDNLKGASQGYASMDYEMAGFREADIIKLDILIAEVSAPELSVLIEQSEAHRRARSMVELLKELIPRQMFAVKIQAAIGAKIVASETLSAMRKDVTAKLSGGDVTRRRKLLEKQKKGKKRMAQFGSVEIPPDAYRKLLQRS